jgi:hypothetical protein
MNAFLKNMFFYYHFDNLKLMILLKDRLCGLVVRGPGFDSWRCLIVWDVVGLEWGPLSLVSTI